jgi:hypothetical protein
MIYYNIDVNHPEGSRRLGRVKPPGAPRIARNVAGSGFQVWRAWRRKTQAAFHASGLVIRIVSSTTRGTNHSMRLQYYNRAAAARRDEAPGAGCSHRKGAQ